MADWLRMWHGAPTDPKWRTIAKRASSRPGDVWAVVSVLMDRASQAGDRGCVSGYDAEVIADALGFDAPEVEAIIAALIDKSVIVDGRLASWEKYQPKREDNSTDRVREHRNRVTSRTETQRNAPKHNVTLDTDTDTEKKEEAHASSAREPVASPEIDLRRKIVSAYGDDIPPDTGYVAVWIGQGYDPAICAAVVEAAVQRGKKPKALKYFDGMIREAHETKAPPAPPKAPPPAPADPKTISPSRWHQLLDMRRINGEWNEARYGPPPDKPGCVVPPEVLKLDQDRNGRAA